MTQSANQSLLIHTQYVKDLSFESPNAPHLFFHDDYNSGVDHRDVKVDVNVAFLDKNIVEVTLVVKVECLFKTSTKGGNVTAADGEVSGVRERGDGDDSDDEKNIKQISYVVDMQYSGVFSMKFSELPDEEKNRVLYVNCPQLLFPYARAIVHNIVREGGFAPFHMPVVDFLGIFRERVAKMQNTAE